MGFGGGAGMILHMVISIKENAKLLRTRSFMRKDELPEATVRGGRPIDIPATDVAAWERLRAKVHRQARLAGWLRMSIGLVTASLVAFSVWQFWPDTTQRDWSPAQLQAYHQRKDDQRQYRWFIGDGDVWLHKGHYHNAIFQYRKALELYPQGKHANVRLGYALAYRCKNEQTDCFAASQQLELLYRYHIDEQQLHEIDSLLNISSQHLTQNNH